MEALIPLVLSLIEQALPLIGASSSVTAAAPMVAKAINMIVALTPFIKAEYADLKPRFVAIIAAYKADPATNAAQIAVLEQQEVALDADFDQAAADALAEDGAAKPAG
jgi:hypothetical protein